MPRVDNLMKDHNYRRSWVLSPVRGWYDEDVYRVDHEANAQGILESIERKSTWREERRQIDVHVGVEVLLNVLDVVHLVARAGRYRDWDGQRNWRTTGLGVRVFGSGMSATIDIGAVKALGEGLDPNDGQQSVSVSLTL